MSVTNVHACMHKQDFTSVKAFQKLKPVVRKSLPTKLCLWLSAQLKYSFYSLLKEKGEVCLIFLFFKNKDALICQNTLIVPSVSKLLTHSCNLFSFSVKKS